LRRAGKRTGRGKQAGETARGRPTPATRVLTGGRRATRKDLTRQRKSQPKRRLKGSGTVRSFHVVEIGATQLKIVQCPSTPIPNRTQDKPENPPPNKTGACGDYFPPTGVHLDINNVLPPAQQFAPKADLRGVLCWYDDTNRSNRVADVTDGLSNSILLGECAGREDVWRKRVMTQVNFNSTPKARARGGAWATTDNPYTIGQRVAWAPASGPIPGAIAINNSNEWGHCYYSFHAGGANFAFADGSVRVLSEGTSLWTLAALTTRAGGETIPDF